MIPHNDLEQPAAAELVPAPEVTPLRALAALIGHEINQPLCGILTNAGACLRMLDASPPDIAGVRQTAQRTIRDANRAADILEKLNSLLGTPEFASDQKDVDELVSLVIARLRDALHNGHIAGPTPAGKD